MSDWREHVTQADRDAIADDVEASRAAVYLAPGYRRGDFDDSTRMKEQVDKRLGEELRAALK